MGLENYDEDYMIEGNNISKGIRKLSVKTNKKINIYFGIVIAFLVLFMSFCFFLFICCFIIGELDLAISCIIMSFISLFNVLILLAVGHYMKFMIENSAQQTIIMTRQQRKH